METEIKILGRDDTDVLLHIAPDVFDDPIDLPATKAFLEDPRHHLAVVLEDGLVVGFVSAVHYLHPDKPRPELWINEVGVAPSHQGRGLGKRLMKAVLDLGRDLDCTEAWVLTERSNRPAMGLYGSCGGKTAREDSAMFTFHLDDQGEV